MDNQQSSDFTKGKFTWTIKNFSKLSSKKRYSKTFIVGGYSWRVLIFPKGNNVDYLSLYLDVFGSTSLPYCWSRYAAFSLAVINQVDIKWTVRKETEHEFNERESDWGFTSFMPLRKFYDPGKGYLVKDTCIIDVEVSIPKSGNVNQVDEADGITGSLKSGGQAGQMEMEPPQQEDRGQDLNAVPSPSAQVSTKSTEHSDNPSLTTEVASDPIGELMDFRGLGQIEKVFIPLLEEVCSNYPCLIESQQKRSRRFIEWAFTALGRVLHFLQTKRVKDMNDEACNHLQILWEELETFRFDLTWLEPHVQSALGMKNYLERKMQLKKLRDNVDALEMEMKRLKAKLAVAEADLEIARRDLVQAEEGFEDRDLEAELGYGSDGKSWQTYSRRNKSRKN